MSRPDIRFIFRGEIVSLEGLPVQRTVLDWLREDQRATGTKEGCNEGDCGACMVALASLDPGSPGGVRIEAVNSCIQLLPSLDGKALFTVEDLSIGGQLHPVQQAMVDQNGSQCGFCTPGFVISLWADYENREATPTGAEIRDVLSGNLCRCTGYQPIIAAAAASRRFPRQAIDRTALRQKLETLADSPELAYSQGGQSFKAPKTLDSLAACLQTDPRATLLAGSTDLGIQVTKQGKNLGNLIHLGAVTGFQDIRKEDGTLVIRAGASLNAAFAALASEEPAWHDFAARFASLPVRNAGTIGGNIANGSPIGDSMPPLIALGASLTLRHGQKERTLPLEDFYIAYRKTQLQPGEFILNLNVPIGPAGRIFRVWKVAKRRDQDISAVCAAFAFTLDTGGRMTGVRVGFGGVAAISLRARHTEALLEGQLPGPASLQAVRTALAADFQPLDDMRASAGYRTTIAGNLIDRLFQELADPAVRLDVNRVQA